MKFLIWLFLLVSVLSGDELDILDEIDTQTSSFESQKSHFDARMKLSYQKNGSSDDTKVLYLRLADQKEHINYDLLLIADEDEQKINIKELYYKGSFADVYFYELGRINIKEGVARAYNPTDYFKGSYSLTLSQDPKDRKENRLGALLISQTLFLDKFTIKGIYSPKVSVRKDTFLSDAKYVGLYLDESNSHDRASLYVDYSGFEDVSSSLILHLNEDGLNFGVNLSYIYDSWILYLENSLKFSKNDISKFDLHPQIKKHFAKEKAYIDEASIGFNYTSESNIVTTVEYVLNSGGLDGDDWDEWFELAKNPQFSKALGGLRHELATKELQLSQQSLFIHSLASDLMTNLDVSLLAWINPFDGSFLTQVGLEYAYHDSVQTNFYLRTYHGSTKSEYGTMPNDYEILLEIEYFF